MRGPYGAHAAAPLHHTSWRYGGRVAACGARAAGRADAAHRRDSTRSRRQCRISGVGRDVPAGIAAIGLEHRPVRIETRWSTSNAAGIRKHAAELVALAPDVILAHGASTVAPLLQLTRTVPIVAPVFGDPIGAGFIDSLARPGGNITGFISFEYSMAAKWLELLKETVPSVTRTAILRDPSQGSGTSQFAAIAAVAPTLKVDVSPVNMRDADQITESLKIFARASNGGLVVTGSGASIRYRDLIIALAARHKLPAVYYERSFVAAGGLACYGPDFSDQYRRAAGYVDRILRGEKSAEMPVQAPTKFSLTINLKTAKALGLTVPATVLARADEVIE